MTRSLPTPPPIFNGLILHGPLFILNVISSSLSPSLSQSPDGGEGTVVIVENSAMVVVRTLPLSPLVSLDIWIPSLYPVSSTPICSMLLILQYRKWVLTSQLSRIHPQHLLLYTLDLFSLPCATWRCRLCLVFDEISDQISTPSIKPLSNLYEIMKFQHDDLAIIPSSDLAHPLDNPGLRRWRVVLVALMVSFQ